MLRQKCPLLSLLVLLALAALAVPATFADCLPHAIEAAHGGDAWNGKTAIQADITVVFGGNRLIEGRMWTDTPVGKTRFELADGTILVFDGQDAWKAPSNSPFQGTRFHVLTWPYFLAAPMKLDDPGTKMEDLGAQPFMDGRKMPAGRLTFGDGVGDSPDDWYVVYANPKSHRLEAMAYIVTFGKSAEEAEKEPHAVLYEGYEEVDGVKLSTHWKFYNWSEEKGIFGDPIGDVKLSNLQFVEPPEGAFTAPDGAEKAPAPK